jgi:hypothetical protein
MYAHQVIEDLKLSKSNPAFNSIMVEKVIAKIKSAKHFHFTSDEEVISTLNIKKGCALFLEEQGEYINPPYSTCWFDFDVKTNKRMSKMGYVFYQLHPKWIVSLYFEHNNQFGRWVPFPYSYFIGLGSTTADFDIEDLKKTTELKELKARISDNMIASNHLRVYSKEISKDDTYQMAKDGAHLNAFLNFGLMLINCCNVKISKNPPSENLNKKRRKAAKQELFTFHTLQLILPDKKHSNSSEANTDNLDKSDKRLHFCRGHFKTYTKSNPLFGKYIGRYWWPSQIKGNKEKGFVLKDYSIESRKV